jgi:GT2 family glycosyltransferase
VSGSVGAVLLTMGDRPVELERAVDSIRAQRGVDVELLVVANGAGGPVGAVADDVTVVDLAHNVGIPAGRNVGWRRVGGDLVLFLDDDGWLVGDETLRRAADRFLHEPDLGILSLRIVDEDGHSQRRHVPRLRAGDPERSSDVTTFLGGACIVRRAVLDGVGGLPDEFFYAHEETSVAWRAIDAGWRVAYDSSMQVGHPRTPATRHAAGRWRAARNRVLLARRHLPWPLGVLYVLDWLLIGAIRDPQGLGQALRGTLAGVRLRRVPRRPMRWRTVVRMARLGRPPVV